MDYRQSMLKPSLLLFLSVDHLHAQHMLGGEIVAQGAFNNNPEGREKFTNFLQPIKCPCYLLTDLIEEDFRHEIVPHLIGSSRAALLKRKFEQFYRGTPYHQATLLQRQQTGRRDDDMLFSALTNPALITPWVDILLAKKIALAGIYSVPQISAPLIKNYASKHLLLISWERYSGLRQTYFSNHHLQISRLTPVQGETTFHDAVVKELLRTYQYLKSLSLLPTGETLDVYILCNAADRDQLYNRLTMSVDMFYDFVDIGKVSAQLHIEPASNDSDATQIFLRQLAKNPPTTHYANTNHTYYYKLWQLKHVLNFASAAVFIAALGISAMNIWQISSSADEANSLHLKTLQTLEASQKITAAFPNTYAQAGDMKSGVTVMRKLAQHNIVSDEILRPVSLALDHYAKLEMDELTWQTSSTEPVAKNTQGDIPAQVLTFKGHLTDFANDYRAALNYLEQFQNDLSAQGYQVTALSKPFDDSPSGSIADQSDAVKSPLGFTLKISHRPSL
ncbi:MAG: hypothetical protein HOO95_00610 [Gallionella sp.]|nr:hypothetical protein [Gallionella sp.]